MLFEATFAAAAEVKVLSWLAVGRAAVAGRRASEEELEAPSWRCSYGRTRRGRCKLAARESVSAHR